MIREKGRILLLCALAAGLAPIACSLLVENKAEQCQTDADCSEISGTNCDTSLHICSSHGTTSSGGSTGSSTGGTGGSTNTAGSGGTTDTACDAGDCWHCDPTNDQEFLNACTDAKCVKFDNKQRCKHLNADGTVPPLDASFN